MIRRKLGEARTRYEQDVEAAIRRVPQWVGREVSYGMLVGGLNNRNWRIEIGGDPRRYFLKIPGEGTEMFIDRVAANEAAVNAHGLGIGPEVLFFDPADGLEVHEFLEGYRACTTTDFSVPQVQDAVLGLYRTLHGGPKLSLTKTIFDLIDEHLEQARMLNAWMPENLDWLLLYYEQARAAFTASGFDLVSCFNDPMPGNFLVSDGKPMKLIDYEFASTNERSYELGVLFCEMFFDEPKTLELIEKYYGSIRSDLVARVYVCRALADMKWASWAVVSRKLNDWDFDLQKYGVWKYMRARDLFLDPRWDGWLRQL
ncbi:phosphotransferase [Paenirhodobacter sp.]|uniref:phosphotransferase n=1 Tax=Paenirhodobacter sp. TaxID=1965326 RepID=UPI003B5144C1